ncbi:hypothetical protein BU16DRAFT_567387 [Lophium mytilinum]|uniref:Uncharacterized protein n=1 Tax=Lophium mytilinum TaxID=390894 RepID=A0A6A6QAV6_9PEZI|nr:hypothetical protein BU16DRAFT_567387 [Lophium mytilinum]
MSSIDPKLQELDAELARVWRGILEIIFEPCVPYVKETEGGFLVSGKEETGYKLITKDEDLLTFIMADQCDDAAQVLYDIVQKIFGTEVQMTQIEVKPKRAALWPNRINKARVRGHMVLLVMLPDRTQLVVDPTKAQFGFQECGLSLQKFLKDYGVKGDETIPLIFDRETHLQEMEIASKKMVKAMKNMEEAFASLGSFVPGPQYRPQDHYELFQHLRERLSEAYDVWRAGIDDGSSVVEVLSQENVGRESFRKAMLDGAEKAVKDSKGGKLPRFLP